MKKITVRSFCFLAVCLLLAGCEKKLGDGVSLKDIAIGEASIRINAGDVGRLSAYPLPYDCTDYEFTWESADPSIATVDAYGRVTSVDVGNTTVYVSQGNIRKEFAVEVYEVTLQEKITALGVKGVWHFEDAGNLELATLGNNLVAYKMDGNRTVGSPSLEGFSQVAGPTRRNFAVRVPKQSYFRCNHGLAAGGSGKVTVYTLMVEFKIPALGVYYCIYETDDFNMTSDGDFFLRPGADWGIRGNYTDKTRLEAGKWYRMFVTVEDGKAKYYLNGRLIDEKDPGAGSHASWLPEGVLLFADEDGEDNEFDVATVAIWDKALSEGDITNLGGL
jgi:hypothetical protein